MTNLELVEAAKAYVALSNAHRLGWIYPMFDENANYYSAVLGDFQGKASIIESL